MRKQTCTMIAVIVVLVCLTLPASAECVGTPLIATIPFQFSTGKAKLPAGEYVVRCLDTNRSQLVFRSTDGKATAVVPMILVRGRSREGATLVFHRYGRSYFFAQAWAGGSNGLELPMTYAESVAAHEFARNERKRDTITLLARR